MNQTHKRQLRVALRQIEEGRLLIDELAQSLRAELEDLDDYSKKAISLEEEIEGIEEISSDISESISTLDEAFKLKITF